MSSITSTYTSSILDSPRIQPKFQETLRPFNKRPAKSDHAQATPAKLRKLSRLDTAPQRGVGTPAKALASSLKQRRDDRPSGKAPPIVVVPPKRSPGKVRFVGKDLMQDRLASPKEHILGKTVPLGETVQVVVQKPSLGDRSGDKTTNSPKRNIKTVADDDDNTNIFITHTERPQKRTRNPDADFEKRYVEIKSLAWTWVRKYFSNVAPEAQRSLDLLDLAHTSPELMEIANWISCRGRKRTWEDVFNEQRALLVYGILGKVLETHVFTHEMFGADKEQLRELRELDMELLNRDGFYRQRCRAHRIRAYLPDRTTTKTPLYTHSLTTLHASILQLLSPLLPPDSDSQSHPSPPPSPSSAHLLLTILDKAASLSLSLRRQRAVLYHWETHPAVGSILDEESMHVLNGSERYAEKGKEGEGRGRFDDDVEVVTMAGWPGCVAYRPRVDAGAGAGSQSDSDNPDDDDLDGGGKDKKKKEKKKRRKRNHHLGVNRLARAEVCVSRGPAIKPLASLDVDMDKDKDEAGGKDWLGKRLRVEMTERNDAAAAVGAAAATKKEKENVEGGSSRTNAVVAKRVAGWGVAAVSTVLGVGYVVGSNPWIVDEVMEFFG